MQKLDNLITFFFKLTHNRLLAFQISTVLKRIKPFPLSVPTEALGIMNPQKNKKKTKKKTLSSDQITFHQYCFRNYRHTLKILLLLNILVHSILLNSHKMIRASKDVLRRSI